MINGQGPIQPPTYDGALQVPISLSLLEWQNVLNIIAEAPWKTADPLMAAIRKQITTHLATAPTVDQGNELRQ
jgi:hypothetical protein